MGNVRVRGWGCEDMGLGTEGLEAAGGGCMGTGLGDVRLQGCCCKGMGLRGERVWG